MAPDDALNHLVKMLEEAGFEWNRARLDLFWPPFKLWVCQPADCISDLVFATFDYDRENSLSCVEFCRSFDHDKDDLTFDVTIRFHSARGDAPRFPSAGWNSGHITVRRELLTTIQDSPQFKLAIDYSGWDFEAYLE